MNIQAIYKIRLLSLPFQCLCFLFFAFIEMAKIFSTVLNMSGESGHCCLVLDLGGGEYFAFQDEVWC